MFEVAYGRESLTFDLPPGLDGMEVCPKFIASLSSPGRSLLATLKNPLGSSPLSELIHPHDKICVVVPDATRPFPVRELLSVVLDYLSGCGLPDEQVEVAIAYGLHRKLSSQEKDDFLGKDVVSRYRLVDHDATDEENLVRLGETTDDVPIVLHRALTQADFVLALGVVEPHQYAGYSGGAKTIAIGMAGVETISATHSIAFLDHPATGLDRIEDNRFSKALWEIASHTSFRFAINIIINEEGEVAVLACGDPETVHRALVAKAREIMSVPISNPADIAIAGVGHPKDVNLYQASRAVTYLVFAGTPVLKSDGVIIITAHAEEGAGLGVGEQNFYRYFKEYPEVKTMVDQLREKNFAPGAQRAYMLGKALIKHRVIVVGATCPDQVRQLGMISVPDMSKALSEAMKLIQTTGPAKALVIPHALQTLPMLVEKDYGGNNEEVQEKIV